MSHNGYGTGNYLTNFEDYYKSTEESEEEGDIKSAVDSDSSCYHTESEEEDLQSYQGKTKEKPRKENEKKSLNDFKIKVRSLESLRGYSVEKSEKGSSKDVEKIFSRDYDDVCQYKCPLCSKNIDTEMLSAHLESSHVDAGGGNPVLRPSEYSRETWHRCGLCQKALLFTRLKVCYHVKSEHGVSIRDYNDKFMTRTGRQGQQGGRTSSKTEAELQASTVSKDQISDNYSDLLKTLCKICNKTVPLDKFR